MARRWSASIALLAFQVAPVSVKQTAEGRLDVGVGFTGEQYLQESFGCDGGKLGERSVKSQVVSAVFEYMATERVRISGFAGSASASAEDCSAAINTYCSFTPPFSGAFGGVQVAHVEKSFGLGFGLATIPHHEYVGDAYQSSRVLRPTFHARFGNREKAYFRMDLNDVRTPGQAPMHSLGVGFGRPGYHAERGFVGVGFLPYPDVGDGIASVITGNVAIPIQQTGDVLLGAYLGAGQAKGFTIGGRLHLSGGK